MIDNIDPADLTFAFTVAAGRPEYEPVMLVSSIRTYAGRFADSPVWVLVPERGSGIGARTKEKLLNLDTQIIVGDANMNVHSKGEQLLRDPSHSIE